MATKRTSKMITNKEDIQYLLNLSEKEMLSTSFIMDIFGEFNGKNRFQPYDTVEIPANSYGPNTKRNKTKFITTVGLWVFNKCFIEKELFDLFKYINEPITKKKFGKLNDAMSYAILEDTLDLEVLKRFMMKCQKYQPYVHILAPNHTLLMLLVTEKITRRKKELLKKHEKAIAANDEKVVSDIEKELLDYAKELMKDDPSMDMYNSGAKCSFENNFKNLFVMRGAVKDPDPNKGYNIITSNFMEGISKDEYAKFANSLAAGPYKRAKKTEIGGYWEKLFMSALQHIRLDPKDSDCGTKRAIEITITNENIKDLMYNYIVDGSRLVELTSENKSMYIGKTVKMRFSSLCESKTGICNRCAGNLFYRLGIMNVGAATPQIPSKLKNISMKSFHDSQVSLVEMDVMKVFGFN